MHGWKSVKAVNTPEKREDQNGGAVHAWMEECEGSKHVREKRGSKRWCCSCMDERV
jgi:hypothetical protein